MNNPNEKSINEVIKQLEDIILEAEKENSPLGYFATLYQKVTIKVKEEIAKNNFDDNPRMEKLDVVFAQRYLDAYSNWIKNKKVTQSWQYAFKMADNPLIVLQHLLLGMNAHINLDLGIAAADISDNENIDSLKNDFNKINDILSSLVQEVQDDLAKIWPTLKRILQWTKNVDNFLVDFSMELARDGAWKFAKELVDSNHPEMLINERDVKVTHKASIITEPGTIAKIIFRIIRWSEKGSVLDRIKILRYKVK